MDSVHFYDNNFFLGESHARELAERIAPLGLRWWAEGRVDVLARYSPDTWKRLRRAGLTTIFCGAESGSDAVLRAMRRAYRHDSYLAILDRVRAAMPAAAIPSSAWMHETG